MGVLLVAGVAFKWRYMLCFDCCKKKNNTVIGVNLKDRFQMFNVVKLVLILCLNFCLVACGGGGSNDSVDEEVTFSLTVSNTNPSNNAASVSRSDSITAKFNENLLVSSVDGSRYYLQSQSGYESISVSVSGSVASLVAIEPLLLLTPYTATLSAQIEGESGAKLESDFSWSFITEDGEWGEAVKIENGAASGRDVQVAVNESGNALAVWVQSNGVQDSIWANRYTAIDGWGTAALIETNDAGPAATPQLAIDDDGNVLVVWSQSNGSVASVWANRYTVGAGWGVAGLLEVDDTGAVLNPKIAVDNNGNTFAIWSQYDGPHGIPGGTAKSYIWVNYYTVGIGWGVAEQIEAHSQGGAGYPEIAFDDEGNALAIWTQTGVAEHIWASRYSVGAGWGVAEEIEAAGMGNGFLPDIAFDDAGNAIAVWGQYDGVNTNIWSNRYAAGVGWGEAERIENSAVDSGSFPRIAVDSLGSALVVWQQMDSGRSSIWANRYSLNVGWGEAELIESNDVGHAYAPHLAVDSNGNAMAIWRQNSLTARSDIWFSRYLNNKGWESPELVETNDIEASFAPGLAVDGNGRFMAAWFQLDYITGTNNIWANRFE
ncbi:Ig-like domain-containing protein [Dasania marina]|uniref:Ig-like domain-containing protein n=1 Tax=Dasania marina TaxID=471499 RepID=UPI0030DBC5B9|tara:strand:- start:7612 stop:9411 length:1800 start_codon:yes stop_codon:yes gene_type:complete